MKERVVYIDAVKAFAIFTVVFGHICQHYGSGEIIVNVVHCGILPFHMPLFAILSGLFVNVDLPFTDFLKKKILGIAVPYFVWCFISFFVLKAVVDVCEYLTHGTPIHFMGWIMCFWGGIIDWGFWFLRALFFSQVYMYLFCIVFKEHRQVGILLSIVLLYGCSFFEIIPNKNDSLSGFIFLYPFLVCGYMLKSYLQAITKSWLCFIVSAMLFAVCMIYWNGFEDSFYAMNTSIYATAGYNNIYGSVIIWKTIYRVVVGISGSLVIIFVFSRLRTPAKIVNFILPIGINTLGIYVLHFYFFDIFKKNLVTSFLPLSPFELLLLTFFVISSCYLMIKILQKSKLLSLLLFGKR